MIIKGKRITGKSIVNTINVYGANTTIYILPKYGHWLTSIDSKSNAQIFEPGHETTNNIKQGNWW